MSADAGKGLPELGARAVAWLRERDPQAEAELYLYRGRDRGIDLREGRPESSQEAAEEGLGLRLVKDGRMAFSYVGGLGLGGLPDLYRRAADQLPLLEPDEHRVLPAPRAPAPGPGALSETLRDPALFTTPLAEMTPRLLEMHARAMKADPRIKQVLQLAYAENTAEAAIAATTGTATCETQTYASFGLTVLGGSGEEIQVNGGSRLARFASDLDFAATVDEAVARTTALLDARKLPSKRCAVLFDPWVAPELLDLFAGALSAEAVQRGKSLLKGKMGGRVASDLVTFVDEPLRPKGISSGRYDDEGVPTSDKLMVEKGVLKEYFYDAYTAHKDGRSSNGCAGRGGYKGIPGASASNFYLRPGLLSREKLLADTRDGILVLEIMGMHTADPISGEMSVGISGLAIRGGEIAHGVRGAMLSGNLLEMLARVDAVADDLTFYGSLAAPTFRIADVTIA